MSQMCVLLSLLTLSGYTQVSSAKSLKLLMEQWTSYKNQCSQSIVTTPPASVQQGVVYRVCSGDGRWAPKNTSECEQDDPGQHYGSILSKFRAMYTVGYSLSLGALVLALGILVSFRKLHCMRNNIHMNLFSSFILRAVSILIKDVLLDSLSVPLAPGADTHHQVDTHTHTHTGAPLIFVLPWVIVKYLYENEECWERNINMGYWWIIRSPILLAYLMNFFIFIRIIKILMSKLKAHQMRYTDYKFRLAKSTLTLIPLLGIHAILFTLVIDESVPKGSKMRLIRLFYDLLFNSFQVRRSNLHHFLYGHHRMCPKWHPLPYIVHYFCPGPTGHY
eukprot:XP_014039001.1 PREDICTED: glucagon receptor-like [Salmo salar]